MRGWATAVVFALAVGTGSSLFQPAVAAQEQMAPEQPPRAAPGGGLPLRAPGCTNKVASAPRLHGTRQSTVGVPGSPFGVIVAPHRRYAVASVMPSAHRRGELAVLRFGSTPPTVARAFQPPASASPWGLAISPNGRYLAVAASSATEVLSLPKLLAGRSRALLPDQRCAAGMPAGR